MANQIHAALRSAKGQATAHNNDAYYFNGTYAGLAQMDRFSSFTDDFPISSCLFAICDGTDDGGKGALAANTAAASLSDYQQTLLSTEFSHSFPDWMLSTNDELLKSESRSTCTVAAVCITNRCIYLAQLGDSRIYRCHDRQCVQLTHDHTKVQMLMDAGILSSDQARVHPQRDMVTRKLGLRELTLEKCRHSLIRPMPMMNGDRYLLCSDGVSDLLPQDDLEHILSDLPTAEQCADVLWNAVLSAGVPDNATLIVFDLDLEQDPSMPAHITSPAPEHVKLTEKAVTVSPDDPDTLVFTQAYTVYTPSGQPINIRTQISGGGLDAENFPGISIEIKPFR